MSQPAGGTLTTHSHQLYRRGSAFQRGQQQARSLSLLDERVGPSQRLDVYLTLGGAAGLLSASGGGGASDVKKGGGEWLHPGGGGGAAGVITSEMTT